MAHNVTMQINEKVVLHKDVEIEVKKDRAKLGTLLVSKGNVEWLPANHHVNKYRLSWTKMAALMEDEKYRVKVK